MKWFQGFVLALSFVALGFAVYALIIAVEAREHSITLLIRMEQRCERQERFNDAVRVISKERDEEIEKHK